MATNTDIRIRVGFPRHWKIKRVKKRFGKEACWAIVELLCYVAEYRPDGSLVGMSDQAIAEAADWDGDADEFVAFLRDEALLLDEVDGGYLVHDWEEHNPYAAGAPERSAAASNAGKASGKARRKQPGDDQGELFERNSTGRSIRSTDSETRSTDSETRSTPSPSPSPSPDPSLDVGSLSGASPASAHEPAREETQAEVVDFVPEPYLRGLPATLHPVAAAIWLNHPDGHRGDPREFAAEIRRLGFAVPVPLVIACQNRAKESDQWLGGKVESAAKFVRIGDFERRYRLPARASPRGGGGKLTASEVLAEAALMRQEGL